MEITRINKRILTRKMYETTDDYTVNFTLNLLGAICQQEECPLIIIRIASNHLGLLARDQKL